MRDLTEQKQAKRARQPEQEMKLMPGLSEWQGITPCQPTLGGFRQLYNPILGRVGRAHEFLVTLLGRIPIKLHFDRSIGVFYLVAWVIEVSREISPRKKRAKPSAALHYSLSHSGEQLYRRMYWKYGRFTSSLRILILSVLQLYHGGRLGYVEYVVQDE